MTHRWSISLRLTAWFGGIFFLGWLLFGAAMWWNLRSTLVGERYGTLARREERLEKLLAETRGEDQSARAQKFVEFAGATGHGLSEVLRADNGEAYFPPSSEARQFPWPALRGFGSERFKQVHWEGDRFWVLGRPFSLGSQKLYLVAAAPEAGNELVLARFLTALLASIPVLLLVSSAGGYFLSRRALLPVDRITASARSISITNLSERLPVARTGDELQRLAETCNQMLERLEIAVSRIRQFTADASHDLRGPVSFMRTVAEVALRNPRADAESRSALEDIVEESAKTSLLLEALLTLARADADRAEIVLVPLDLRSVVAEACEIARPLAAERQHALIVDLGGAKNPRVLGDFASLRRLFWILLDNAVKYTPSPGRINVNLSSSAQEVVAAVRDNGIGISPEDLPRIFDRFFRADPSRGQIEGSGLGLSIAKWLAESHCARLSVSSTVNSGTIFEVTFPQCPY
jgi:two-component system, OmpR family, heavy metal sensor histidine kinase CusS